MVQLYREQCDTDAVVAAITAEYAVDATTAEKDLHHLLLEMERHGLAESIA